MGIHSTDFFFSLTLDDTVTCFSILRTNRL